MKNKDLISIIIPVYNVEEYIERCIKSVLEQSYKNLEIILVDDGSQDSSGAICDKYKNIDTRINVIHKENGGLSEARNFGIDVATGKYLFFLDSDDYIEHTCIEELYNLCNNNNCEIAVCDFLECYDLCDVKNTNIENKIYNAKDLINTMYDNQKVNLIVAWNKLYLANLFEDIRYPVGKIHEDEYTTYKLLYKANKIAVTSEKLYFYYQNPKSITNKKYNISRLDAIGAFEQRMQFFYEHKEDKLYILTQVRYCNELIKAYFKTKKYIKNSKDIQKDIINKIKPNVKQVMKYKDVKFIKKLKIIIAYAFIMISYF